MAKIAAAIEHALRRRRESGGAGVPEAQLLARGDGWRAADVVCASGPGDRPFEEQHSSYSIAIVAGGMFEHRSAAGCHLMTPGSLMLGAPGQPFECGHDHGCGDRCISFWFAPEYFERIAADAGVRAASLSFKPRRIPPIPDVAPLVARACAGITGAVPVPWQELGLQLAARVLTLLDGRDDAAHPPSGAIARVAAVISTIEQTPGDAWDLQQLAHHAELSPYHFLRTFERVAGVTPHQFLLRARLRESARRLATSVEPIIDVALDCGFNDVSNFNRAFRREFGVTPRQFRAGTTRTNMP